jgi:outer membrane protein OmpU
MNNLKKVGLTALAGSLVAVSAQAGEMAVTGSANVSYTHGKGLGKSIGSDKDVTFTGSGELDNGWSFVVSTTTTDAMSVSSSYTSLTMGSLGTFTVGTGTGGASGAYDEEVPQAYEQVSDQNVGNHAANKIGDNLDNNSLVYNSPSFDLGGASVAFDLSYSPNAHDGAAADGGSAAFLPEVNDGYGVGINAAMGGFKVGAFAAEFDADDSQGASDAFQTVGFINYSAGPIAVGYSQSYSDSGDNGGAETAVTAKSASTDGDNGFYEGHQWSVAMNVNENLSVSYTEAETTYDAQAGAATGVAEIADVDLKSDAIQVAYSMGAMSIKAYRMSHENPGYDEDAKDVDTTEITLGLAF